MSEILRRRDATKKRLDQIRNEVKVAERRLADKACVYATGSFGRLEANDFSDLDLFILGRAKEISDNSSNYEKGVKRSQLNGLDEICIKANLIEATQALNIPDFDGDGRYLTHYSVNQFTEKLGRPEDDAENTMTARLLMLLESKPLVGKETYDELIENIVVAYWRDYEDHKNEFMPAYLTNDIIRLWRTFCVNYEARTERKEGHKKIEGKIKNYKLKHSRMLTCYSAIIYLLFVYKQFRTVHPDEAIKMAKITPIERIEFIAEQKEFRELNNSANSIIEQYNIFLENTNSDKKQLAEIFENAGLGRQYMEKSRNFGMAMFKTLQEIGNNNDFYRIVVI